MNIEHPTSNNVFCQIKKSCVSLFRLAKGLGRLGAILPFETCPPLEDSRYLDHVFSVIRLL